MINTYVCIVRPNLQKPHCMNFTVVGQLNAQNLRRYFQENGQKEFHMLMENYFW